MRKSIDRICSRLKEPGAKFLEFGIIMTSEPIASVGTPESINVIEHVVMYRVVIEVNNLANVICEIIYIPLNPLDL